MVGGIPVPGGGAFCFLQEPLAVFFLRRHQDGFPGPGGCPAAEGFHAVVIQVRQQAGSLLLIRPVFRLILQEILVFPEGVGFKVILDIHAVLNPQELLLHGEVEKVIDGNTEDSGQFRQQGDIRHRDGVFPFGYSLGAEPELLRELLLCQGSPEAELFDFRSDSHDDFPPCQMSKAALQVES